MDRPCVHLPTSHFLRDCVKDALAFWKGGVIASLRKKLAIEGRANEQAEIVRQPTGANEVLSTCRLRLAQGLLAVMAEHAAGTRDTLHLLALHRLNDDKKPKYNLNWGCCPRVGW